MLVSKMFNGIYMCYLFLKGFVISDWQGIDRITSPPHANYSYSIQAGIHAGIDMVCCRVFFINYFLLYIYLFKLEFPYR